MSAMYDQEQYRTLAGPAPRVDSLADELQQSAFTDATIEKADRVGMDDAVRQIKEATE